MFTLVVRGWPLSPVAMIVGLSVAVLGAAVPQGWALPGTTEGTSAMAAPTYDEVRRELATLAAGSPHIDVSSCGFSAEGYPIPVVFVWDRAGAGAGWEAEPTKPTLLITASIHAGESCGTDALLILLRRIAEGREPQLVMHTRLALVPVFNVDGYRNRSIYHRFTQNGPAGGFGTRRNALNLDLNRDFTKLDSPAVRAIVRLFSQLQPDVFIDLHTDDGVGHQYDILYSALANPTLPGDRDRLVREALIPFVDRAMAEAGFLSHPIGYFADRMDPHAGLFAYGLRQRTGYGYFDTRHCIAILSEAYPYRPYESRVAATLAFVQSVAEFAVRHRITLTETITRARQEAMRWAAEPGRHEVALGCRADTTHSRMIDWRGKQFGVIESEVTGNPYALYTEKDTTYQVPFYDRLSASVTQTVPRGYLILPAYRHIAQKLRQHGIGVHSIQASYAGAIECYRIEKAAYDHAPYQGHSRVEVKGDWRRVESEADGHRRSVTIPAGSYWVPLDQPAGCAAMHLLEPEAPDALLVWNVCDAVTERGIILETWALEENARRLLADPAVRAEYEAALADSSFAADEDRKLEFFFQKTPYVEPWEDRYPVFRVLGPAPRTSP